MDKERTNGEADQAMGAMKDAAGRLTGDTKLEAEGKLEKAKGKVESAVGAAKETMREQLNKG